MARYYGDLAAGFGADVVVSTTSAEGPAAGPVAGLRLDRQNFPLARAHRTASLWRWERRLQGIIQTERPDVLLCGNLRPLGPLCEHLARRHGLPRVVFFHGNDLLSAHRRWAGWRRGLWERALGRGALLLANSQAVRRLGVERCGLDPVRTGVLTPEVDTVRFHPVEPSERAALRSSFHLPAGPLALFVGRLVARKGLDRLIAALPAIREGTLAVAGYGDDGIYREQATALGVSERVRFLGAVTDARLPDLYRSADFLAMPSRTRLDQADIEGFGIVYLEGAASGLPALAGLSGGAPEAVPDGKAGLVVDGDDLAAVTAALTRLFAGCGPHGEVARLGQAARSRVETEFGRGSMARNLRALLEGTIS